MARTHKANTVRSKRRRPRKRGARSKGGESPGTRESDLIAKAIELAQRRAGRLTAGLRLAETGEYPIRLSHLRYFRAKVELIDSGQPPTYVNLAKRMGISTVALWKFRRRHPWVDAWSDGLLIDLARPMFGAIMRRMGLTALQGGGSPQHADQYCKMRAGFYDREGSPGETPEPVPVQFTMNYLVPRPETPVIPGVIVREVQPQLPESRGGVVKEERPPASDPVPFVRVR